MKKLILLFLSIAGLASGKPVQEYNNASSVNDTDLYYVYQVASPHDFNQTALQLKTYVLTNVPGSDIANGTISAAKLSFSLAPVATSGSYNDLLNLPTLGTLAAFSPTGTASSSTFLRGDNTWATVPAQVNADWNAGSGAAQILNKPTIPAAQVNSDWNATSGVAQVLNHPITGTTGIGNGADFVTVSGLNLGFTPSFVIVTVRKTTGDYNLFATVRGNSMSSDGFTVDLSAATDAATYHLDYLIVK